MTSSANEDSWLWSKDDTGFYMVNLFINCYKKFLGIMLMIRTKEVFGEVFQIKNSTRGETFHLEVCYRMFTFVCVDVE